MRLGVRQAVMALMGWLCVGGAITVLIRLNLGVAPFDVLNTAIGERIGYDAGVGTWISGAVLVSVAWVMGVRPGVGTVLGFFGIGWIINTALRIVPDIEPIGVRVGAVPVALAVLYLGVCFIIVSGIGAGPTEVLTLALHQRGMSLRAARWGVEFGCASVGWALGGSIGVLTAVITVVAGPCIGFLLPAVRAWADKHWWV